jgi:glycosyltransferase involved in cell wall biosynthesis
MRKLLRTVWRAQPLALRRWTMRQLTGLLARPIDRHRPIAKGDIVIGGFLGSASGLGQSARQMLQFFQAQGFTAHGANVSRFAALEDFAAGPVWPEQAAAGGISIFQVNPDILALALRGIGRERFRQRRLVGYWLWELETIPAYWRPAIKLVDEIWVPTRFIAAAFRKAQPTVPVHVVPCLTDLAPYAAPLTSDPLPQFAGRPVVFFSYDVRSTMARKNPEAVIRAFRKILPHPARPLLVIKAGNEHAWEPARQRLQDAIGDTPDVHVLRETLSTSAMQDLIKRADIVMSLHRSEGFGYLMAEGMAAGKPVIATGYSANLDFMDQNCSRLIDYQLVPVSDPQLAYNLPGAVWAEADSDQAAAALKELLDDPALRQRLGAAARQRVTDYFDPQRWLQTLPESFTAALAKAKST